MEVFADFCPAEVAGDFVAFVNGLGTLAKDCQVKYSGTKFDYASLDAILAAVKKNQKFGASWRVSRTLEGTVKVTPELLHISGAKLVGDAVEYSDRDQQGKGPQSMGAVITYCKRYTLAAMLGIACDPDTDATDQAPVELQPVARPTQQPPAKPAPAKAGPAPAVEPWDDEQKAALTLARKELPDVDWGALARQALGRVPWGEGGTPMSHEEADELLSAAIGMMQERQAAKAAAGEIPEAD